MPDVQVEPKAPFALNRHENPVTLIPANQIAREDQDLLANAESTIQEKAGFESLDFDKSGWTYQQIACPALPGHLLLRFSRDADGSRAVSMFSAAIPRGQEGKVRIIPIVRKGYSLFSPAPINALTISAFNHIRGEEPNLAQADWVSTGLCYGALTGADPVSETTLSSVGPAGQLDVPAAAPPLLQVGDDGGASIRFVARNEAGKPMLWTMHFDKKGVLLKAQHETATLVVAKPMPEPLAHPTPKPAALHDK